MSELENDEQRVSLPESALLRILLEKARLNFGLAEACRQIGELEKAREETATIETADQAFLKACAIAWPTDEPTN